MPRGAIQVGVSIGAGSAYANDRLAPAAAMADSGRVTYIGFDSLAERTMALAQRIAEVEPAAVAIAHKILVAVYHMLRDGTFYKDLGPNYLDNLDKRQVSRRLVRRLNAMGFDVVLSPKAA